MIKSPLIISALAAAMLLFTGLSAADETQAKESVYGSQLMTQKERTEYRSKMRDAKSAEEREKIRAEHHEQMKVRAKEKGVTIPDEPPARGMGQGQGQGMGPGNGRGRNN
ncbi:MAG: hypothetical protein A2513_03960 [Sulfurimonas sp. RIFOXYD12_FULL_33_39]|uniref:hypothetical protein n=1 Tax=unclassified Sulfurimonas TaxID=2623549 RepID=UPI0008C853D3|nr:MULTISPECIES: hypothetical protein [unclassified Sulfurimonas]OHE07785.1 MAG: hypothetical protein A3G74_06675 [Sulfurimonas sp. RIFCSPLOWO2_12_FULL_34_6]OHE09292.1 MAG: hypothetical protein A2513_03960 [Sulfurimonas sp. RIFOXYD12_FULL_33_39]OHE12925.1 MAG: hypothetical protein A2530_04845 [Sulfurimonas sp. RIFOXYD2_FULL_34_21]